MVQKKLIPRQYTGAKTDVIESVVLDDKIQAEEYYVLARERLLNVYEWDKICNLPSSKFILIDQSGKEVKRHARINDYFKIDIPVPGNEAGDGFDWVKIEEIKEIPGVSVAIQVRPCANPFANETVTAHFFKDKATSTFIVRRDGNTIFAEVHGRNELPNTETEALINNIRNALIAWGAKLGFSFPQWKCLLMGILDFEDKVELD